MTIAELGAIGEFIGSITVIVTLIFLTLQLRQNTLAVRASMSADLTNQFIANAHSIANDPAMADLFAKAASGHYEDLSDGEKVMMMFWSMGSLKAGEFAHYQWSRGNLDEDLWNGTAQSLVMGLSDPNNPMSIAWQAGVGEICTPAFRDYIKAIRSP